MSNKESFPSLLKADGIDAGYRIGAKQMTKAVKVAASNMMRSRKAKKNQVDAVAEFLDTEFGESLISMSLGTGLHFIPGLNADPRAQRLAKEFRVEGMASAGNLVAGTLMEYLMPAIRDTLATLPAEPAEEVVSVPAKKTKAPVEAEMVEVETSAPAAKSKS